MIRACSFIGSISLVVGLIGCGQQPTSPIQNLEAGIQNGGQIIGGEAATGDEGFAKTIAIVYNVNVGSLCTASILTDTTVITAAHCVSGIPQDLRVVFGTDLENVDPKKVRAVTTFEVSPVWFARQNEEKNTGDIAIIKMYGGIPEGYQPAKFLSNAKSLETNKPTLLAGYGLSDGVNGLGAGLLRSVTTTIKDARFTKTEVLIDQSKGKGACHGDSGGPAMVEIDGEYYVYGVTSRGVDDVNDDCSVAAAYTSIPAYKNWIHRTLKKMNAN